MKQITSKKRIPKEILCLTCDGSGVIIPLEENIMDEIFTNPKCPDCKGTGKMKVIND